MSLLAQFPRLRSLLPLAGALALMSVGCGAYEPEPEYPEAYVAPPPTSQELAEQQRIAAANAQAERPPVVDESQPQDMSDADPSALTEFKPVLDPHGAWVDDPVYGTVWVPNETEVGTDFTPYVTAGHWTYAEDGGNVWVSDYDWGYVPFHYGRWVLVSGRGWCWIPGRRYAGAWVVWRTGPVGYGYVGWAAAPPLFYWSGHRAFMFRHGYYAPYYSYCSTGDLYHHHVGGRVLRGPRVVHVEGGTRPYAPRHVVANPSVDGRVVAKPSVGGGRVIASPHAGPRPSELGIQPERVAKTPTGHPGLTKARAFARPEVSPRRVNTASLQNAPRRISTGPGYSRPPTDYTRSYTGARPTYVPPRSITPSRSSTLGPPPRGTMASTPSYRPAPIRRSTNTTFSSSRAYRSPPVYRSSPPRSYRSSTPSYRAPTFRSSPSRSFRSSPSYRAPTFRSSPSRRSSSSVFRSSPSRSFRSSPSRSFRSSPSRSFRSSPSRSFRSSGGSRRSRR